MAGNAIEVEGLTVKERSHLLIVLKRDRHQLRLLAAYINCGTSFLISEYGRKGSVPIVWFRLLRWQNDRSPVDIGLAGCFSSPSSGGDWAG
jgi:hypothetical protein